MKRTLALPLVACMLAAVGCGHGPGTHSVDPARMPQDTPQATIAKMVRSMEAGDRTAFLACWQTEPAERDLLEATFDFVLVRRELDRRATEKFGAEVWRSAWNETGYKDESRDPFADWDPDETEVTVEGGRAVASIEGRADKVTLLLSDGVWKIYDDRITGGEDIILATRLLRTKKAALEAGLNALDEAETPADVHAAIQQSLRDRREMLMRQIEEGN
jgi:hypothetical protein